jgi:hypothetical protein
LPATEASFIKGFDGAGSLVFGSATTPGFEVFFTSALAVNLVSVQAGDVAVLFSGWVLIFSS